MNACLLSVVKRFVDQMVFDSGNIDSTVAVMTAGETQRSNQLCNILLLLCSVAADGG